MATTQKATDEQATTKNTKAEKPKGWVSPVELAKHYSCQKNGVEFTPENYASLVEAGTHVPPQQMYGYLNNNQTFRETFAQRNTDNRWMVELKPALKFLAERDATRAASKAAKAAEEAAKATEEG